MDGWMDYILEEMKLNAEDNVGTLSGKNVTLHGFSYIYKVTTTAFFLI